MEELGKILFVTILWPIIRILILIVIVAILAALIYIGIKTKIKHQAEKTAEAIDYDKLAKKIADEIERRQTNNSKAK